MENQLIPNDGKRLNIFRTDADRTSYDLRQMSDFMANRVKDLMLSLAEDKHTITEYIPLEDAAIIDEALHSRGSIIKDGYEYLLDFDSLPKDILVKFRKGIYKLGESRQVDGNLRAVIVDETGTRVKDVTLKKAQKVAESSRNMQNIAIQMQLKQINEKLDYIVELQDYHIDLTRNNALVAPFFDARDAAVKAQNEEDPLLRRKYLDESVSFLQQAINKITLDMRTIQEKFLKSTKRSIFRNTRAINKFIGYMTQDLQLLAIYNGVLFQLQDFMGKFQDKQDSYKKYQTFMMDFYTKSIGPKQQALSIQIHNAFDSYTPENMDVWKTMTDEMVPALQNNTAIQGAYIISMGDAFDEKE